MLRIPNFVALLGIVLLSGCATFPQCSIGVAFLGPVPVPTASCDVIFEPEEEDDDGV